MIIKFKLPSRIKRITLANSVVLVAGLLVLGACSGFGLQNARGVQPSGSAFETALHSEYMTQAEGEYAEYDYEYSDLFAERAVASAGGNAPIPLH